MPGSPLLSPLHPKTPAVITQVSLRFCTWSASPQALPHSVPSICSVLFPVLTGPACTGLQAQLRCPSSQMPPQPAARSASPVLCQLPCLPHSTPSITSLGFSWALCPRPVPIVLLGTVPGEARSWSRADMGVAQLLGGELRTPCGFLVWVEG